MWNIFGLQEYYISLRDTVIQHIECPSSAQLKSILLSPDNMDHRNMGDINPASKGMPMVLPEYYEVVIVGAGVAGASTAHHLMTAGVRNILVVDGGSLPGEGEEERKSGSAVMDVAPTIKMMVQAYAASSKTFLAHHGRDGARRYLSLTAEGLKIQKKLAKEVLPDPNEQLRELGSFYVAYEEDEADFRNEFETLQSLGCDDIQWYDQEMLKTVRGCSPDFHCGIFFPNDAIIDSSSYSKALLRAAESVGSVSCLLGTTVAKVSEEDETAVVYLESGERIHCKHVVMATGGLFQIPELAGILMPCYSYLVHVPVDKFESYCEYSSNFFSWGFTHDWSFTKGKIRCSGEDHNSAFKPPLCEERCRRLTDWTLERYSCNKDDVPHLPGQYGIYSETPDCAPLIGSTTTNSKVCYLLGCNAWGQAVLSYSSSLVPGILGYTSLTDEQQDHLKLLSIRRFTELPSNLSHLRES